MIVMPGRNVLARCFLLSSEALKIEKIVMCARWHQTIPFHRCSIVAEEIYTPQNYLAIRSICQLRSQFNLPGFQQNRLLCQTPHL